MVKLPISALVASFNEGHLLEHCLKSLHFCDEIVVVNLNSKDKTEEIAKKHATSCLLETEDKGFFDAYHSKYIPLLKHDWFILIDPDERIKPALADDIKKYISNPQPFASLVRGPILYLFKGKRLKGGPYQKVIRGRLLFYKPGINLSDEVHTGITAKAGYVIGEIPFTGENYDEHFWCNSWKQIRDKHTRYSKGEGKVLYQEGKRFNILLMFIQTVKSFYNSFIKQAYYRDGFTGLKFSLFEARYTFLSWLSLSVYQKELVSKNELKSPKEYLIIEAKEKLETFKLTSGELMAQYQLANNALKSQILKQYQKALLRFQNDLLELNAFDLAKEVNIIAGFNDEMKQFIMNDLLIERLKLIQNSGSYKLAKYISKLKNK